MAGENAAVVCAAASVEVVGGTPRFATSRGLGSTITDNGRGDFTFTLEAKEDPRALAVSVVGHHSAFASFVAQVGEGHVRVRGFDHAGAALDNVGFSLVVFRIG